MSKLKKSEAFTAEREREIQQVRDLSLAVAHYRVWFVGLILFLVLVGRGIR